MTCPRLPSRTPDEFNGGRAGASRRPCAPCSEWRSNSRADQRWACVRDSPAAAAGADALPFRLRQVRRIALHLLLDGGYTAARVLGAPQRGSHRPASLKPFKRALSNHLPKRAN